MSTVAQLMTSVIFLRILNSRITLAPAHAGETMRAYVQGNGNFLPKGHTYTVGGETRTTEWDRTIHNLQANSALAMADAENKKLLAQAFDAEQAGEKDKADELFRAYLNAVQISFSTGENSTVSFNNNQRVEFEVDTVVTKAGSQAIVVNKVRPVAAANLKAVKFDVADLIS